jgi:hypothetical protein
MSEKITLEDFERRVKAHDLTFAYSDDGSVYSRGSADLYAIQEMAKQFPIEDVKRIWNAMVDAFLVESVRPDFYWKLVLVNGNWVHDKTAA